MKEPRNSLIKQYTTMLAMDNIELGLPTSDIIHQLIAPHELQGLIDSSSR